MDYKEIKINWQKIDIPWILFTNFDWRKLSTSDQSRNLEGLHSRVVSPTFARIRIITIEWVVEKIDWIEKVAERINHLQNIFSLQTNLVELEEKELYIKDIFWNEWKMPVKVKEPFEFYEDTEIKGSHYNFRVVLESTKSPIYRSFESINIFSEKGWALWFRLNFKLWKKFNENVWLLEVNAVNFDVSPIFEIDILKNFSWPLKILNLNDKKFFSISWDFFIWEKIIVDMEKFTVTKNNENIIDRRLPWSLWLSAKWKTKFIVVNNSKDFLKKDFKVKVSYNNVML